MNTMDAVCSDLLAEVRAFRQRYPEVRYVDLISLDIPGHFYGKRYPVDMLEKVAAGSALKLPQNCVLLGVQGGLFKIGDYCFNDGDPDACAAWCPAPQARDLGKSAAGADADHLRRHRQTDRVRTPRSAGKVLDRLASKGIHPVVAFELEFYLFDKKLRDGMPQFPRDELTDDADDQPNMHIERLSRFAPVLDDMVEATRAQGIDATVITAELGRASSRSISAIWTTAARRRLGGAVLSQHPRRCAQARLSRQLHGQAVPAASGQRHACACQPVRRRRQQPAGRQSPTAAAPRGGRLPGSAAAQHADLRAEPERHAPFGGTVNAATARAGVTRIATPACASPSRTRKTCASNTAWPAPTPTRIWCWRRFWWAWNMVWNQGKEPIPPLNDDRNSGIAFPRKSSMPRALQHQRNCVRDWAEFVDVYCENKRQDHLAFMQEISAREYRWYL
jgi:glutamine synthetase